MMDPQNPRLSADGLHVVSGFRTSIWLDGRDTEVRGQYPQVDNDGRVLFLDAADGLVRELLGAGLSNPLSAVGCNSLAVGGGTWIGGRTAAGDVRLVFPNGASIPGATDPTLADDGSAAWLLDPDKTQRRLMVNGNVVAVGPFGNPRISQSGVVFERYDGAIPTTHGILRSQWNATNPVIQRWHAAAGWEVEPVIIDGPDGPWIISHDETRTLLHPADSTFGYAFQGLKTPDCRWAPSLGKFRVVGDTTTDVFDMLVDSLTPRVDLSESGQSFISVDQFTEPKYIGYFKWDARWSVGNWAHVETLVDAISAQGMGLHIICSATIAVEPAVKWEKVAAIFVDNTDNFGGDIDDLERRIEQASVIVLASSRPDLRPIAAYWDTRIAPSRMPRGADWFVAQCYCEPDESINSFLASVRTERAKIPASMPLIYAVQASNRNGKETDIGKVTKLQSQWPKLLAERGLGLLYFALKRDGGTKDFLAQWQPWHAATAKASPRTPDVRSIPRTPVEAPRVTILNTWGPREGQAPLIVTVPVQLSGGRATKLSVFADGLLPIIVTNPPARFDHTFMFDRPGTYAIFAQVEPGGDKTQQPRIVIVTKGEEPVLLKPYPDENGEWKTEVEAQIAATYLEAGRTVDLEPVRWSNRTLYDYLDGLTIDASLKKHIAELRAELGLPPS